MAYHKRWSGGELPCAWTLSQKISLLPGSPHCDWYWQIFFLILEHNWLTVCNTSFLSFFLFIGSFTVASLYASLGRDSVSIWASLGCYFQYRLLPSAKRTSGLPEPSVYPKNGPELWALPFKSCHPWATLGSESWLLTFSIAKRKQQKIPFFFFFFRPCHEAL